MQFIRTRAVGRTTMLALALAVAAIAATTVTAAPVRKSDVGGEHIHARAGMSVKIKVRKDAMKGYNLFLTTKNFRWAPEHASGKHVRGEGHAHLFIDGKKVTRLYGPAYYLGELAEGSHTVTVSLNANNHASYVHGDNEVSATKTVVVPAATSTQMK